MNKPVPLVSKYDPEHSGPKENQGEEEAHYFQILLPFLHPPEMIQSLKDTNLNSESLVLGKTSIPLKFLIESHLFSKAKNPTTRPATAPAM